MLKRLENIIYDCLREHEGGEKFFDAIDESLRNDNMLITMMIGKILDNEKFDYLIVSGKFGKVFKNFVMKHIGENFLNKIILVNGGLRCGEKVNNFYDEYDIIGKNIIFVDDSYYLGRTRDKIKNAIEKHQGKLICSYVFYDGSKEKDSSVHSFYRYYDHFDINKSDN